MTLDEIRRLVTTATTDGWCVYYYIQRPVHERAVLPALAPGPWPLGHPSRLRVLTPTSRAVQETE
jgi:hypothetical protein